MGHSDHQGDAGRYGKPGTVSLGSTGVTEDVESPIRRVLYLNTRDHSMALTSNFTMVPDQFFKALGDLTRLPVLVLLSCMGVVCYWTGVRGAGSTTDSSGFAGVGPSSPEDNVRCCYHANPI